MAYSTVERFNITLPKALAKRLRGKKNVSAFIAESVQARLDEEAKARTEATLAEAYSAAADEEDRDWDSTAGDGL